MSRHNRIDSLDAGRGLIMIVMAVDLVLNFLGRFHPGDFWYIRPPVSPVPASSSCDSEPTAIP